jgi:hypothetical protein
VVTVEAYLDVGQQCDAHDSRIRTMMAATLADFITRTQQYVCPHCGRWDLRHGLHGPVRTCARSNRSAHCGKFP